MASILEGTTLGTDYVQAKKIARASAWLGSVTNQADAELLPTGLLNWKIRVNLQLRV